MPTPASKRKATYHELTPQLKKQANLENLIDAAEVYIQNKTSESVMKNNLERTHRSVLDIVHRVDLQLFVESKIVDYEKEIAEAKHEYEPAVKGSPVHIREFCKKLGAKNPGSSTGNNNGGLGASIRPDPPVIVLNFGDEDDEDNAYKVPQVVLEEMVDDLRTVSFAVDYFLIKRKNMPKIEACHWLLATYPFASEPVPAGCSADDFAGVFWYKNIFIYLYNLFKWIIILEAKLAT